MSRPALCDATLDGADAACAHRSDGVRGERRGRGATASRPAVSAGAAGAPSAPTTAVRYWYLAGVASWFIPQGMLSVLVPWIIGEHLQLGAGRYFGFAYTVFTLPTVLLVLVGGLAVDRFDARRILIIVQTGLGLLALAVMGISAGGWLSYPVLLGYLLAVGVSSAFVRPARDWLLTPVAGSRVQPLVTAATAVQFGVQIAGFSIAAAVELLGIAPMFAAMGTVLLFGALGTARLPVSRVTGDEPAPYAEGSRRADTIAAVLNEPIRALRAAPGLTPVMLINLVVGVCYTGAYFVIVPSLILGFEGTGAGELSAANVAFMSGTLVATFVLPRTGGLVGRHVSSMLAALVVNGIALATICLANSMVWVIAGMLVWGMGTGVAIVLGRTIVQERAPVSLRARLLALYTLTFLSGTPLGSLLMGLLAERFGAPAAGIGAAGLTVGVLLVLGLATDLARADAFVPPGEDRED
jgi:MFS family permease